MNNVVCICQLFFTGYMYDTTMVTGHEPRLVDTKIKDIKWFEARESLRSSANKNTRDRCIISQPATACLLIQVIKLQYFVSLKVGHERCVLYTYAELPGLAWSRWTCSKEWSIFPLTGPSALSRTARSLRSAAYDTANNALTPYQSACFQLD